MVVGVGLVLRKCRQDTERLRLGKGFMAMGMELVVARGGVRGGRTIVGVGIMVMVGSFRKITGGEYVVLVELVFVVGGGRPGVLLRSAGIGTEEAVTGRRSPVAEDSGTVYVHIGIGAGR